MSNVFGFDMAADFASTFAGDLSAATITRRQPGTYDVNDPSAGPSTRDTSYSADAIVFEYDENLIVTEQVKDADFMVTIMIGSIKNLSTGLLERYIPQPGDTINIPPPSQTIAVDAVVSAIKSATPVAVTCIVHGQLSDG